MSMLIRPTRAPRPREQPRAAFAWAEAQSAARAHSSRADPMRLFAEGVALADAGTVLLCSSVAYLARYGLVLQPVELSVTLLAVLLTYNAMRLCGAYAHDPARRLPVQVARAAQAFSLVFVLLLLLGYLTKTSGQVSRLWAVGWYMLALLGFAAVRVVAHAQLARWRRRGRLARTVAIVDLSQDGDGALLARRLRQHSAGDIQLVGVFLGSAGNAAAPDGVEDLIALSRLFRIDEVAVAPGNAPAAEADAVLRRLSTIPTTVRICPRVPSLALPAREAALFFGQPALTIHQKPLAGLSSLAKRVEDVVLSAVITLMLLPLMALVAFAIRVDSPGPVLFRQPRLGFNNNVITVFKFRSMHHRVESGVPQATRHDPRVTRVGRLLRRSSLDELPQLFNVLRGEMSLVGPRPHAVAHNEQYAALIDDYLGRHRVQPGITGWAQVNGFRGETDTLDKMQRRVEHDLAYIDNWSILLDLKILALTAVVGLFNGNAY